MLEYFPDIAQFLGKSSKFICNMEISKKEI